MSRKPPISVEMEVVGVRETLAELATLDPKLRRATLAEMRKAAGPMVAAVSAALPAGPPVSGMSRGRTAYGPNARKASAKTGGRKSKSRDSWPLLSVRAASPAASLFDMAGRGSHGKTPSGQTLIGALTSRYGSASRAVWPAAEKTAPVVTQAVRKACDDAARQVSVRLDHRPI